MSEYFSLYCTTCKEEEPYANDCSRTVAQDLLAIARHPLFFLRIYDDMNTLLGTSDMKIQIGWQSHTINIRWLQEHALHKLGVRSEYPSVPIRF